MNEDYLWDKSGAPDPEIQQLEEILGTLRYQPKPLRLAPGSSAARKRNYLALLAIAATLAIALLAGGLWLQTRSTETSIPSVAFVTPATPIPSVTPDTPVTPILSPAALPKRRPSLHAAKHDNQEATAAKAFSDKDADEREIKKLIAGVKGIYVKSFEFDSDGQFTTADVDAIRAQVRGPGWTRLVNVTSKKEGNVEVYLLMMGEEIGGLAVLSSEDRELTVVNIVGPVDLEKLAKLEGQFGVPELGIEKTKPKKDEN